MHNVHTREDPRQKIAGRGEPQPITQAWSEFLNFVLGPIMVETGVEDSTGISLSDYRPCRLRSPLRARLRLGGINKAIEPIHLLQRICMSEAIP